MDFIGENRFPGDAADSDLRLVLANLARAAEDDLDTWSPERAAQVERLAQWVARAAHHRGPSLDDPKVREGVQAYIRLTKELGSITADPAKRARADAYAEPLSAAAWEANAAMGAAGLLGVPYERMVALARQLDPTFDQKG
jgi:hypothetical protein